MQSENIRQPQHQLRPLNSPAFRRRDEASQDASLQTRARPGGFNQHKVRELESELGKKEAIIRQLRDRCQRFRRDQTQRDIDTQIFQSSIARANKDLEESHAVIEAQSEELKACKDDLFRLQPFAQVSDSDILNQYDAVCQYISNWIDGEISNSERYNGSSLKMSTVLPGDNPGVSELLQVMPEAGEYFLAYLIHQRIQQEFFVEGVYFFGLSEAITKYVRDAEKGMAKLEPPRDITTINMWRSETLKALAINPEVIEERKRNLWVFSLELHRTLRCYFRFVGDISISVVQLHEQISIPVSNLESDIKLSSSRYVFSPTLCETNFVDGDLVHVKHLKYSKFIDVSTRKTLKGESQVEIDERGFIGEAMWLQEPKLSREKETSRTGKILRQAVYLIKLSSPLKKRKVHSQ